MEKKDAFQYYSMIWKIIGCFNLCKTILFFCFCLAPRLMRKNQFLKWLKKWEHLNYYSSFPSQVLSYSKEYSSFFLDLTILIWKVIIISPYLGRRGCLLLFFIAIFEEPYKFRLFCLATKSDKITFLFNICAIFLSPSPMHMT